MSENKPTPIDDGGPAFPVPGNPATMPGMSLRDWFAGQALNGLLAGEQNSAYSDREGKSVDEWRANIRNMNAAYCYQMADAMLAARKAVRP